MTAPQFIAHEARLLDERRYDEWLALFADDGNTAGHALRRGTISCGLLF